MSDHETHADEHEHHSHEGGEWRVTSPMQEFTMGQAWTGLVVAVIGLLITFGVTLALA
ncbi:MAG: DUF7550 family protein [Halobacteriota archaeon]